MSDFGSMITVRRDDGTSTTSADEAAIKDAAKDLVVSSGNRSSDYADFNLRFGSSREPDGSRGITVGLTEYWLGDEESTEGLDSEVLLARDRPLAERFAEELQQKLGPDFKVEAYCDHW